MLQAVELLSNFYDRMGSIFGKIKDELLGNVKKARDNIPEGYFSFQKQNLQNIKVFSKYFIVSSLYFHFVLLIKI